MHLFQLNKNYLQYIFILITFITEPFKKFIYKYLFQIVIYFFSILKTQIKKLKFSLILYHTKKQHFKSKNFIFFKLFKTFDIK